MADASHARDAFEVLAHAVAGARRAFRAPVDAADAGPVLRCLADALEANQAMLDTKLFPAMFESVAGSDAVCIRAMQAGLASLHRELTGYVLSIGMQPAGSSRLRELLLSGCAQYMACQLDEVFPMAERMLES